MGTGIMSSTTKTSKQASINETIAGLQQQSWRIWATVLFDNGMQPWRMDDRLS